MSTVKIAGLILLVLLIPAMAFGKSAIKFGKIYITPTIQYQAAFDSNIFLADDDDDDSSGSVEADLIHKITPSIRFEYQKNTSNYIKFGYSQQIVLYTDYSENNYTKHAVFGNFAYKPSRDFYFRIDDKYVDTEDPYGSVNNYGEGEQTKRWDNTFDMVFGYSLPGKSKLELIYQNHIQKYDTKKDKWQDTISNEPGIKLYYKILPKTSLFVEYRIQICEYTAQQDVHDNTLDISAEEAQDFKHHKFFTGFHWDATSKINGDLKFGFGRKDYDNDLNWNDLEYQDYNTWLAETAFIYKQTPKRSFNVKLSRSIEDSSDFGYTTYTRTVAGVGMSQMLGEKWEATGSFYYTFDDYKGGGANAREDDKYKASLGVNYSVFKWLTIGLGYACTIRNSSDDQEDYTRDSYFFNIKGTFDFFAGRGEIERL